MECEQQSNKVLEPNTPVENHGLSRYCTLSHSTKVLIFGVFKTLIILSAQNLCTVLYIIVFSHLVRCLFPHFITVTTHSPD